jgi:serine/threonine-protein kinase RsbW
MRRPFHITPPGFTSHRPGEPRPAERSGVAYGRDISTRVLLTETFDHSAITTLRHAVASRAADAGLDGDRLEDFVVAVNELLTNAVRHGGGLGRVALWSADDAVVCEVSDTGMGLPDAVPEKPVRPATTQPGGWGLWLAEELTDTFQLITGAGGTTVRVSSRVSLRES